MTAAGLAGREARYLGFRNFDLVFRYIDLVFEVISVLFWEMLGLA